MQLDNAGQVIWGAAPDSWLLETTGYSSRELLPINADLDLQKVEPTSRQFYQSADVLRQLPGYHIIRWTTDLIESLPAMLSANRTLKGKAGMDDLDEFSVQDEIEKLFARLFPSRKFFKRDYDFSKAIGIYQKGREKNIDFAIFNPAGSALEAVMEVKRTSSKTQILRNEICKDIARLLILSQRFRCTCYLLVCGNTKTICSQLGKINDILSFVNHDADRDRHFTVKPHEIDGIDGEYARMLMSFNITEGASRFQGMKNEGANSVMLWQITVDMYKLALNRPYQCNIQALG